MRVANHSTGLFSRLWRMIRFAYASWSAILGTILGSLAVTSLAFELVSITPSDLLRQLLSAYRQTFHPPLELLLSWLPFRLPVMVKDAILLYGAIGGILFRALSFGNSGGSILLWRLRILYGRVLVVLLWPKFLIYFLKRPGYIIRTNGKFNGRLPARSRTVAEETILNFMPGSEIVCTDRGLIFIYGLALAFAVFSLIVLNTALERLSLEP